MSGELRTERHEHTLVLTISNPDAKNALSPQIYAAGVEALNVAEANRDIGAVVITGDGGVFCAGGNLQRLLNNRQLPPEVQSASIDQLHNWIEVIRAFPKPVIAAVEGAAAGAGFSLALACDLIVAADSAKFVLAYSTVALSPDGGATWQLNQMLPRQLITEWLWLGKPVSARRLQELGVVNHVTDNGRALDDALVMAAELCRRAPNALASIKELLNEAPGRPLSAQLAAEREAFVRNLFHDHAQEGIRAFLDKRPARYS